MPCRSSPRRGSCVASRQARATRRSCAHAVLQEKSARAWPRSGTTRRCARSPGRSPSGSSSATRLSPSWCCSRRASSSSRQGALEHCGCWPDSARLPRPERSRRSTAATGSARPCSPAYSVLGSLGLDSARPGAGRPLNRRYGFDPTLLAGIFGTGIAWLALGATSGSVAVASLLFGLGLALLDFSGMVFFINYLTLRQAAAPDALRGRVIATMICLTVAAGPLGGLAGGWIAEHAGLRAPMFFAGAGAIVLVLIAAWGSPLLRLRSLEEI